MVYSDPDARNAEPMVYSDPDARNASVPSVRVAVGRCWSLFEPGRCLEASNRPRAAIGSEGRRLDNHPT